MVPLSFVLVLALGGALAIVGVNLPLVEPGIALSLVVLGLFIAAAVRLPLMASAAIVSVFALMHGYAHGSEIPSATSGLPYVAGFMLATVGLNAAGIGFGQLMRNRHASQVIRVAGAAIALCGVYLGMR